MATIIRVQPEELRRVAGTFKQKSSESQNMISQLTSAVTGLQGQWEGMSQQRFYGDFQNWSTSMKSFVEMLNNIGLQLEQVAARIEAADQSK